MGERRSEMSRCSSRIEEGTRISSRLLRTCSVDLFTRQPNGKWLLASADRLDAAIKLQSIDGTLALADLYDGIDLSPAALVP